MPLAFHFAADDLLPGEAFIPGSVGRGDMPFTRMSAMNPSSLFWPSGPRITYDGDALYFQDYAVGTALTRVEADLNYGPESSRFGNPAPMTTWSARWYYWLEEDLLFSTPQPVVEFLDDGGVMTFGINLQEAVAFQDVSRQLRFYGPSWATTYTTYQLPVGQWMRFELQVDGSASPKCTCRVYAGDNLTPVVTFTGSPSSVEALTLRLGDNNASLYTKGYKIRKIDVWDTYDADGAMPGALYEDERQNYEWFEWDAVNEELVPLEVVGTWDAFTGTIDTADTTFTEWDVRVVAPPEFLDDEVEYANYGRRADVYIPATPAPPGGYTCYLYFHGGFFVAGDKNQMASGLIYSLLDRNIVVVNANYILSQLDVTGTPPTWPDRAVYPEHLIDAKLVMKWIEANLPEVNTEKIIVGGFSAGSWIGHALATTVGMDDDGQGRDLRVSGAIGATRGGAGLGDDILPMGCFTFAPLVNLQLAWDRDLSHPNFGPGDLGYGAIHLGMTAFMGTYYTSTPNFDGTSISEYMAIQAAEGRPVPPIAVTHGSSDYLLDWTQTADLVAAGATHGFEVTTFSAPGILHELTDKIFDINDFDVWLESIGG